MKLSMRVPKSFLHSDGNPNERNNGSKLEEGLDKRNADNTNQDAGNGQGKEKESNCCCCGPGKWNFFTSDSKLRTVCLITAILHLCAVFVVSGITDAQNRNNIKIPRLKTPITKNIGLWVYANETFDVDETPLIGNLQLDECPLASAVQSKRSGLVVQQLVLDAKGEIDTRLVIVFFHLFSFLFQVASSMSNNYYEDLDIGKVNLGHYFEYTISAPLMLIAMAAQFGITDVYLLLSIAANCAGCMLFGALAEFMFYENTELRVSFGTDKKGSKKPRPPSFRIWGHWVAHCSGWILLSIALVATCSNLNTYDACADKSEIQMPDWVIIIVSSQVFLFSCFGIVQFVSFRCRKSSDIDTGNSSAPNTGSKQYPDDFSQEILENNKNIAYRTELAYIILSLTAKMLLSTLIVANNYTNS